MSCIRTFLFAVFLLPCAGTQALSLSPQQQKIAEDFVKRIELRPFSAEMQRRAEAASVAAKGKDSSIDVKAVVEQEIKRIAFEYQQKVDEIFRVSYLQIEQVKFHDFFNKQIERIVRNPEGQKVLSTAIALFELIDSLSTLVQDTDIQSVVRKFSLRVDFGEGASLFAASGNSLQTLGLAMNLNLIGDDTFFHKQLGLCTFVPCLSSVEIHPLNRKNIINVRSCADPFWLLIAHESIHMNHCMISRINSFCFDYIFGDLKESEIHSNVAQISKNIKKLQKHLSGKSVAFDVIDKILETTNEEFSVGNLYRFFKDSKRFHVRYKENLTMSARQFIGIEPELAPLFPELGQHVRQNHLDLCDKLEERETVIGSTLSELTIRLAERLPIRYIYQGSDVSLYEYLDIVCKVIEKTQIGRTFSGKEAELSAYIKEYIDNASNDIYFNSRSFLQKKDYRLFSEIVFNEFGLKYTPLPSFTKEESIGQYSSSVVIKKMKIMSSTRRFIEAAVKSFNLSDLKKTVSEICSMSGGKVTKIKPEVLALLRGRFPEVEKVVSGVETYILSINDGMYNPSRIEPLILLFAQIIEKEFKEPSPMSGGASVTVPFDTAHVFSSTKTPPKIRMKAIIEEVRDIVSQEIKEDKTKGFFARIIEGNMIAERFRHLLNLNENEEIRARVLRLDTFCRRGTCDEYELAKVGTDSRATTLGTDLEMVRDALRAHLEKGE